MKAHAKLAAPLLLLGLAACSQGGYSGFTYDLDTLKTATPTGSAFTQHLSKDYLALAETNRSEDNWPVMSLWADKGLQADHGVAVAPEDVANWSYASLQLGGVEGTFFTPDSAAVPALNEAHERLVAMLGTDATARFPEYAATAQTKFDCWVEATHEAWEAQTIVACRKGFEDAMAAMIVPPKAAAATSTQTTVQAKMAPGAYVVFFDFDKSDIKPEAQRTIALAAQAINAGNGVKIAVVGDTDTVGTEQYNLKLSFRRADAVQQELVKDGVNAANISVDGRGKDDLLVQTPDGVREPQNRRGSIELVQ